MMTAKGRELSGSELVFGLLKSLMIGYRLWGTDSGLAVSDLRQVLGATDIGLGGALAFLIREGLVSLDQVAGTVRLSDAGARNLLGETSH